MSWKVITFMSSSGGDDPAPAGTRFTVVEATVLVVAPDEFFSSTKNSYIASISSILSAGKIGGALPLVRP